MEIDNMEIDPLPHHPDGPTSTKKSEDDSENITCLPSPDEARRVVYDHLKHEPITRDPNFLGGNYIWGGKVGEGASGKVYRIEELGTGIPFVIKVLKWEVREERKVIDTIAWAAAIVAEGLSLECEAMALAVNFHPHIIEIHDYIGNEEGRGAPFRGLITEAMDGDVWELVGDLIEVGKTLDDEIVFTMLVQILAALDSMHRCGWAHCDIKPDNIFYTERAGKYTFKLGDLGLATNVVDEEETPEFQNVFSAPEAKNNRLGGVCAKSDIWSLLVSIMWVLNAGGFRDEVSREFPVQDLSRPVLALRHQKKLEKIAREDKRLSPLRNMLNPDHMRRSDAAGIRRKVRGRVTFWGS